MAPNPCKVSDNICFTTRKSRLVNICSPALPCYNFCMTELLQQALAQLRQMPDEMQDSVALALIARLDEDFDGRVTLN
jgi:hypothetical protein